MKMKNDKRKLKPTGLFKSDKEILATSFPKEFAILDFLWKEGRHLLNDTRTFFKLGEIFFC